MWSCYCLVLPVASRLTIDSEWKRLTTLMIFLIKKLNFLGHFWHSETFFGVITDLCEVFICLVLPVASRLTIDSEWKRLTILMIFDKKIEFFRSFLALWDYFWGHYWLMWSCYLDCLACGCSFDHRFWMETNHNPYDFWLKNWNFWVIFGTLRLFLES